MSWPCINPDCTLNRGHVPPCQSASKTDDLRAERDAFKRELEGANVAIAGLKARETDFVLVLAELVRLKDGPRDAAYQEAKDLAWARARASLKTYFEVRR